jgi:hypothetical protein
MLGTIHATRWDWTSGKSGKPATALHDSHLRTVLMTFQVQLMANSKFETLTSLLKIAGHKWRQRLGDWNGDTDVRLVPLVCRRAS